MTPKYLSYLVRIRYLGFRYHGWAKQTNAKTVQGQIERTIRYVLGEEKFKVLGAGRTDSMVSANHGAFQLFVKSPIDTAHFLKSFNANLPPDIEALNIQSVHNDFNILRDVNQKEYVYLFADNGKNHPFIAPFVTSFSDKLDIDLIKKGAAVFSGTHDFRSYCYQYHEGIDPIRTIQSCLISEKTNLDFPLIPNSCNQLTVRGKGFMRHQIRLMMGALFQLGSRQITLDDLKLSLEGRSCPFEKMVAPASGLMLNKIWFKGID